MKSKTLALTNGIFGLIGGIALVFAPLFILGGITNDALNDDGSATSTVVLSIIFILVKIAILVLGIVGLITYKGTGLVKTAAHVLFFFCGAVALIPLLGIAGGIVSIVGGALYLASLKNFKTDAQ